MVEGAPTMANHISPAAQLFRGMAELIDHDHTSQTHYDAVTKAAAAWRPAPAPSSWSPGRCGRLTAPACWRRPTPFRLACPDRPPPPARSRRSSRPTQRRRRVAMTPRQTTPPGHRRCCCGSDRPAGADRRRRAAPVDPRSLPGPPLQHLDPADEARLWTALSELRRGQVLPRGQLIRLTGWLPTDLAVQLLACWSAGRPWSGRRRPASAR